MSFGDDEWQRYKVFASDLGGYLDEMFFTTIQGGKSGFVLERAKKAAQVEVVVIDNNPTDLDLIRDLAPDLRTYCMNRVPDKARSPADSFMLLKFFEARRYLEKLPRHQHIPCRSLGEIL